MAECKARDQHSQRNTASAPAVGSVGVEELHSGGLGSTVYGTAAFRLATNPSGGDMGLLECEKGVLESEAACAKHW
jgi:hypothetical protein